MVNIYLIPESEPSELWKMDLWKATLLRLRLQVHPSCAGLRVWIIVSANCDRNGPPKLNMERPQLSARVRLT